MTVRDRDKRLFDGESEVLRLAHSLMEDPKYRDNELVPAYAQLAANYDKLLKLIRKIFLISDSQGRVLQQRQRELRNLLDNANQGFLTFGADLLVDKQYSAECARIFDMKIAGVPVYVLLAGGDRNKESELQTAFTRVFDLCKQEEQEQALKKLPRQLLVYNRTIQIEYKIIPQVEEDFGRLLVMMILTDVSDKLKAEEQIRFLSYHDKLTSLYNRAYLDMRLSELEVDRCMALSVIVVDLNGLKLTNDIFGHAQGDKLLVSMAEILTKACRKDDIIVRWGGDEFVVLLPGADRKACEQVVMRIQTALEKQPTNPIPLSAAIGSATRDQGHFVDFTELFSAAENRMYRQKISESRHVRQIILRHIIETLTQDNYPNPQHIARMRALLESLGAKQADTELSRAFREFVPALSGQEEK
ncbi:MAG: diguanylate cyclase [Negativicutes bacterium]|nr:diguanylate cyclase [Negativicutes bacterium]